MTDIRLPNGKIIRGVPDGTPKEEIARKAIAAGLATEADFNIQGQPAIQPAIQQADRGILSRVSDAFTGSDRQTTETQQLKPIGSAPELNRFSIEAAKTGLVQTFGSEQAFINRLRDMGAALYQDEKGNFIAELPSGRYLVNPPGLDPADIARGIGQAGAFFLGSRLAPQTVAGQTAAGGLTSAAMQGLADVAGGNEMIDPETVAVDALLGGAGQAASNVIGAGARLFGRGATDTAADQAAAFAQQRGLPLMTSDIAPPTTFAGRSAQSIGEKIPLVGTAGSRDAQQQARQGLIRELSEKYGEPSLEEVTRSLLRSANRVKGAAGARLQQTIQQAGDAPISLNNTSAAIDDLIANMTKPGMVVDESVVNALRSFKEQITSAPNNLEMLRQNRTLFRELVKGDAPVLSNTADRANRAVYEAMTKDMVSGVEFTLGPEAARRMRQADAVYAQEVSAIKNTRLKNILAKGDQTPELVGNMLFSKRPSDVAQLYRSLDQAGRKNARAAVVAKAFEQFSVNESPERFLSAMRKMGPQINIMFKGQDRQQLKGLINYLEHTKRAGEASVLTPTGQQLLAPAAVFDIMQTGGGSTAAAGTIAGLARVYESKPVMKLMLRLSKETPGTAKFEAASRELTRAITAETQRQSEGL